MIPLILVGSKHQITQFVQAERKKNNGQVITIKPQKTEYSIGQIREIAAQAYIYHKELRIYFLENFHHASLEAQNAFLKLLEEPPTATQFILTVPNIHLLLPTIISRAKVIVLEKNLKATPPASTTKKKFLSHNQLVTSDSKETTLNIVDELIFLFRKNLASNIHHPAILKEILTVKKLIENNNINHQLGLDHLLIFIKKRYNGYNSYNNYKSYK
jgi:replication-associated recombination protein RarA